MDGSESVGIMLPALVPEPTKTKAKKVKQMAKLGSRSRTPRAATLPPSSLGSGDLAALESKAKAKALRLRAERIRELSLQAAVAQAAVGLNADKTKPVIDRASVEATNNAIAWAAAKSSSYSFERYANAMEKEVRRLPIGVSASTEAPPPASVAAPAMRPPPPAAPPPPLAPPPLVPPAAPPPPPAPPPTAPPPAAPLPPAPPSSAPAPTTSPLAAPPPPALPPLVPSVTEPASEPGDLGEDEACALLGRAHAPEHAPLLAAALALIARALGSSGVDDVQRMVSKLRIANGLAGIFDAIGHDHHEVSRDALSVAVCLCSEASVGAAVAHESRAALREGERLSRLVRCLFANEDDVVLRAARVCEHACTTYEAACAMRDGGATRQLQQLAKHSNPAMRRSIGTVLRKMKRALEEGEKLARVAEKWQASAASVVQLACRRWLARRRRQKLLLQTRAAVTFEGSMKPPSDDESEEEFEDDFEEEDDEEEERVGPLGALGLLGWSPDGGGARGAAEVLPAHCP